MLARELNDRPSIADALETLGWAAFRQGDGEKAERCTEDSLALYKEIGDRRMIAWVLRTLGAVVTLRGDYEERKRYLEESLAIEREIGNRAGAAGCLNNLGEGARMQGKYAEAVRYYEEALAIKRELGILVGGLLNNLGHAYIGLGKDDVAWGYLREALKESLSTRRVPLALEGLIGVALLRTKARRHARAAELLGLVLGHPALDESTRWYAEPVLDTLHEALPAGELEAALEHGKALDLEQVVAGILAEAE